MEFVPLAGETFSQLATGATIDHFTDLPAPLATCTVWLAAFCPTVAWTLMDFGLTESVAAAGPADNCDGHANAARTKTNKPSLVERVLMWAPGSDLWLPSLRRHQTSRAAPERPRCQRNLLRLAPIRRWMTQQRTHVHTGREVRTNFAKALRSAGEAIARNYAMGGASTALEQEGCRRARSQNSSNLPRVAPAVSGISRGLPTAS